MDVLLSVGEKWSVEMDGRGSRVALCRKPVLVAAPGVPIGDLVLPVLDGELAIRFRSGRIEVRQRVVGVGERHHVHDGNRVHPGLTASRISPLVEFPGVGHLVACADQLRHEIAGELVRLLDDLAIAAPLQGGSDISEKLIDTLLPLIALEAGNEALGAIERVKEERRRRCDPLASDLLQIDDGDDAVRRFDIVDVG
nr:hypothetical protein SHINE37_50006 [Rhizobiaceae bacterium]CAI0341038.1 hypothetical protein SHINE37_60006 [Rhizobiaceae bacterium]